MTITDYGSTCPDVWTHEHVEEIADQLGDVGNWTIPDPSSEWHRDRAGITREAHAAARRGDVGEAVRLAVLGRLPVVRYPAAHTLADRLGLDDKIVRQALADLEARGWIHVRDDGREVDVLGPATLTTWGA